MLALAIGCGLVTVIVGVAGLSQMGKVNDMLNSLYDGNLVPTADIANANMQAIYHNRELLSFVTETDRERMKAIRADMAQHRAQAERLLDKYRKTELTPSEVDLLAKFDKAWPHYLSMAEQAATMSEGGG